MLQRGQELILDHQHSGEEPVIPFVVPDSLSGTTKSCSHRSGELPGTIGPAVGLPRPPPGHHHVPNPETRLAQVYVVAWIGLDPPTLREVLRIEALSRPGLLSGVGSALRKGGIAPGLELVIIDCPAGEAPMLRADIEEQMA
ncbi:hypothetical protein [Geminicoccus flavidas]|uniref:hypothetical protein n=1 Tax=Geminicoccus flavidas TaxID=2506407 RepID=UPI00135AA326|nr:hypothetical protein [Geminicoccus flavidas]